MTTRRDVDRLGQGLTRASDLAIADLRKFVDSLDLTRPELVRDELVEFVPMLTTRYGDIAATAAAEWYEQVRSEAVSGPYSARLGDVADQQQVIGSVRYAAGNLFTDAPLDVLLILSGAVQRYVSYAGRQTVARNAEHDPRHPRYARVPSGMKTCTFCEMVASRGFVYRSEQRAGLDNEYHDHCHCQIVPEWDRGQIHIAGYDPDAMYDRYLEAAGRVGGTHDTSAILAEMRRAFPDAYTDGVLEDAA